MNKIKGKLEMKEGVWMSIMFVIGSGIRYFFELIFILFCINLMFIVPENSGIR